MDNQKSQTGNGSNFGKEGSGSSMGKDMQKESGNNLGGTGGNAGASGTGLNKSLDANKSDINKPSDQNKSTQATNNAFDANKSTDASKSLDAGKSSDQAKADFPKTPGLATAPSSDSFKSDSSKIDSGKSASLSGTTADAHKTIDKALDAAQPMADRLATSAHAGVDKLSGALTDASARMEDKTKQLTEAYKNFADSGREYVRSSPATSVLVALAAGYTLSKLLGRRH